MNDELDRESQKIINAINKLPTSREAARCIENYLSDNAITLQLIDEKNNLSEHRLAIQCAFVYTIMTIPHDTGKQAHDPEEIDFFLRFSTNTLHTISDIITRYLTPYFDMAESPHVQVLRTALYVELLRREDSAWNVPTRQIFSAYAYNQLTSKLTFDQTINSYQHRALQLYSTAAQSANHINNEQTQYALTNGLELAIRLARLDPQEEYRNAIHKFVTLAYLQDASCFDKISATAIGALDDISFIVHPEQRSRTHRSTSTISIEPTGSITVQSPESARIGDEFVVSVYLTDLEQDNPNPYSDLQVEFTVDAPTIKVCQTSSVTGLAVAKFRAAPLTYTTQVLIQILAGSISIFRATFSVDIGDENIDEMYRDHTCFLSLIDADLVIDAFIEPGRYSVRLRPGLNRNNKTDEIKILDRQIQNTPELYMRRRLERINYSLRKRKPDWIKANTLVQNLINQTTLELSGELIGKHIATQDANIAITTNEYHVPWELIKTSELNGTPICAQYNVSTVPFSFRPVEEFEFEALTLYTSFEDDRNAISQLVQASPIKLVDIRSTNSQRTVTDSISPPGVLYVGLHGRSHRRERINYLTVDDCEGFDDSNDITVDQFIRRFNVAGRFVFINGCDVGAPEAGMFSSQSWAEHLMHAGAVGYLGAKWAISDEIAPIFAERFFKTLLEGHTVPKCVRLARQHAHEMSAPSDTTWLAYSLYCHPTLRPLITYQRDSS